MDHMHMIILTAGHVEYMPVHLLDRALIVLLIRF